MFIFEITSIMYVLYGILRIPVKNNSFFFFFLVVKMRIYIKGLEKEPTKVHN